MCFNKNELNMMAGSGGRYDKEMLFSHIKSFERIFLWGASTLGGGRQMDFGQWY